MLRVKENDLHFFYFPSSSSITIIIIENGDPFSMAGAQTIRCDYPSLTYLTKHTSAKMPHHCQEFPSFFTLKKMLAANKPDSMAARFRSHITCHSLA